MAYDVINGQNYAKQLISHLCLNEIGFFAEKSADDLRTEGGFLHLHKRLASQ